MLQKSSINGLENVVNHDSVGENGEQVWRAINGSKVCFIDGKPAMGNPAVLGYLKSIEEDKPKGVNAVDYLAERDNVNLNGLSKPQKKWDAYNDAMKQRDPNWLPFSYGGLKMDVPEFERRRDKAVKFDNIFSKTNLKNHWQSHGAEFKQRLGKNLTEKDYEAYAKAVIESPVGGNIDGIVRASNGQVVRYDKRNKIMVVGDPNWGVATLHFLQNNYHGNGMTPDQYFLHQKKTQEWR